MIDVAAIESLYFIGIGGIGMSALARYFNTRGVSVSGYDKTPSELTHQLEQEGIAIHYSEDINVIPKKVSAVIYTPAVPAAHAELVWYRDNNYTVIKRSELLEAVTHSAYTIAVAGTHGKTTTSTLIAHILKNSGYDCTAFLGGISVNYNTNYLSGNNNIIVVEADEYDRSFLRLHPDIAVITSTDADHLDIYGDVNEVERSYIQFGNKIKPNGTLIIKNGLPIVKDIEVSNKKTYSANDNTSGAYAENIHIANGNYIFTFRDTRTIIDNLILSVPGMHNVENAVAAISVSLVVGIDPTKIKESIAAFAGVKRRFEYIVRSAKCIYIDDYAHHPREIEACLSAVRSLYPLSKITCIFQPHLYTRTRDFADAFATSLSLADDVILLPIYPARELPIEGVNSQMILDKIPLTNKCLSEKQDLLKLIEDKNPELLVTLGAGDIDQFIHPLKDLLNKVSV